MVSICALVPGKGTHHRIFDDVVPMDFPEIKGGSAAESGMEIFVAY